MLKALVSDNWFKPRSPQVLVLQWFGVWTAIGVIFALQLHWYYELPWSRAIFWGLSDWYLWGLLALVVYVSVRAFRKRCRNAWIRTLSYALTAPIAAGSHVALTIVVGGLDELPSGVDWAGYFQILYAKKLMLNLATFGVLVGFSERVTALVANKEQTFPAKLGDHRRLVKESEINWAEVCGNHVNLYTNQGTWPVRQTLTELATRLPDSAFLRINRSQLINLDCIDKTRSAGGRLEITLSDRSTVTVSRRYQPSVRRAMKLSSALDKADR